MDTQAPYPPIPNTSSQPDIDRIRWLYDALQLHHDTQREEDFLALVRAWLLRYTPSNRLPLSSATNGIDLDTLIDDATLAFLFTFGQRLWPSSSESRGHLVEGATLEWRYDVHREDLRQERQEQHRGDRWQVGERRELRSFAQRFSCRPLRQVVRMCFPSVSGIPYTAAEFDGEEGEVGIDGLFARVVRPRESA